MNSKKKKFVQLTAVPKLMAFCIDNGEEYFSSQLAKILLNRVDSRNGNAELRLTKKDGLEYVKGLADGGVMYAGNLRNLIEASDVVEVSISTYEREE